jgi:hypothetical protein
VSVLDAVASELRTVSETINALMSSLAINPDALRNAATEVVKRLSALGWTLVTAQARAATREALARAAATADGVPFGQARGVYLSWAEDLIAALEDDGLAVVSAPPRPPGAALDGVAAGVAAAQLSEPLAGPQTGAEGSVR